MPPTDPEENLPEPQSSAPKKRSRGNRVSKPPEKSKDSRLALQRMKVKTEIEESSPESKAEEASRLRIKEADAIHQQRKELIFIILVAVIGVGSLFIASSSWFNSDTKGKAFTLLGVIVSGSGTYLFTRPRQPGP